MGWRDDYGIVKLLGAGAFAQVYLARSLVTGALAALKMLRPELGQDPDTYKQMLVEAQGLDLLRSDRIVSLLHIYQKEWVLVLEYLPGGSLDTRIKARRLSTVEAATVGLDAAEGLESAHEGGFVHRDIKPHNLLFTGDGRIKVADFGLAVLRPRGSLLDLDSQQDDGIAGTIRYMSPEVLRGRPAEPRSDLYSLCVTLFEAVTGIHAFGAPSIREVIRAIGHDAPDWAQARESGMDPRLESILSRGLEKDPAARYPSMESLRRELQRLVASPAERRHPVEINPGIVGREEELAFMDRNYAEIADPGARGRTILVAGEAGTGKSTLTEEFRRIGPSAQRDPSATLSFREGNRGLAAIAQCLGTLLGAAAFGRDDTLLAELAAYRKPDPANPSSFSALVDRCLVGLGSRGHFLLVAEDIHEADADALTALRVAMQAIPSTKGMLVLTYRPEELGSNSERARQRREFLSWAQADRNCQTLVLGPLAPALAAALLRRQFDAGASPPEELEALVQKVAQGNPLFIRDAVLDLFASRIVTRGGHLLGRLDSWQIPRRIHDVVARRLLTLPSELRKLLQVAAVEGDLFRSSVVAAALDSSRDDVIDSLDTLMREYDLVQPIGFDYRFRHAIHREVILADLLPEKRTGFHGRIADHLRAANDSAPDEIAHHLLGARRFDEAVPFLIDAARSASAHSASGHASSLLATARHILSTGKPRTASYFRVTHDLAKLLGLARKQSEARSLFEEVEASGQPPSRLRATAIHDLAWMELRDGNAAAARRKFVEARSMFQAAGDRRWAAACLDGCGQASLSAGDLRRALRETRQALVERRRLRFGWGVAISEANLGMLYRAMGRPAKALASHHAASTYFAKQTGVLDAKRKQAIALSNIGALGVEQMDLRAAIEAGEAALALRTEIGDRRGEVVSTLVLADAHLESRQPNTALDSYERAADLARSLGLPRLLADSLRGQGAAYHRKGEHDRALKLLEEALREATAHRNNEVECRTRLELAEILLTRGRNGEAGEHLDATEAAARADGLPFFAGRVAYLRGQLKTNRKEVRAAIEEQRRAQAALRRQPSPQLEAQVCDALAALLASRPRGDAESRRLLARAKRIRKGIEERMPKGARRGIADGPDASRTV